MNRAGAVHQYDVAPLDDVRQLAAVRVSRCFADQDQPGVVEPAEFFLRRRDHRVDVGRAHAFTGARSRVTQRRQHDVIGGLHQREFGRRLDHSLSPDDRIAADDWRVRQLPLQTVEQEIAVGLLEADREMRDFALLQEVRDQLQRLLIFFPRADFRGHAQHLGDARPLEEGRDDDRVALGGNDRAGQPLAPPPLDAGIIIEARAGSRPAPRRCRCASSAPWPRRAAAAVRRC